VRPRRSSLLFNGWTNALIMLGIVLLVNRIEGNVLHPLITGGAVKVHPLGIVLGVMAGAAIGGIAGAFFAVPLIATANSMIHAAANYACRTIAHAPTGNDEKATHERRIAHRLSPLHGGEPRATRTIGHAELRQMPPTIVRWQPDRGG